MFKYSYLAHYVQSKTFQFNTTSLCTSLTFPTTIETLESPENSNLLSNLNNTTSRFGQYGFAHYEIYTFQKITRGLRADDKNVYVTCSTGIEANKYSDLGGTTLHKWAGIADGRFLNAAILHLINTDERYKDVKQCIVSADCLIVDEVSMRSATSKFRELWSPARQQI